MRNLTQTVEHVKKIVGNISPSVGIILGTGLGGLVKDVEIKHSLDYSSIPNFPVSTVESHHGNLIFGKISGKNVIVMQGRFHYYEGYIYEDVTFPVEVMSQLGVKNLLVSNACGGLNPFFKKADLMIMRDHINFHFATPLKIKKLAVFNVKPYSTELISLAEKVALENKITIRKGVYLSLKGPQLETRAEYRSVRKFGADAVGMSTIPEALTASSLGMEVLGLSIITDMGLPDTLKPAKLEEILESASVAEPKLTLLTKKIIDRIS